MACEYEAVQEAACASGIGKLDSQVKLLQVIAQLLCEIADAGGGGGLAPANLFGSGDPTGVVTPNGIGQFYTDTSTPPIYALWQATGVADTDWIQIT